jgi:hypothetical protein
MPMETNKPNIEKNQMENLKILYSNFDKLQMAFKANFLKEHLDLLEETKKKAQETHEKELIFLNGVPVHVDEKACNAINTALKLRKKISILLMIAIKRMLIT